MKNQDWLTPRQTTEVQFFENKNWTSTKVLFQSHISFSLLYTEQLRKLKVVG